MKAVFEETLLYHPQSIARGLQNVLVPRVSEVIRSSIESKLSFKKKTNEKKDKNEDIWPTTHMILILN